MATILRLPPDQFCDFYPKDRAQYDRGDFTAETYWSKFAEDARVGLDVTQLEKLRRLDVEMWSNVNPQMLRWIESLSAAGLKTAVLSNMIPDMAVHARQTFGWLNRLTHLVLSCEVRLVKPDRAIYERCLQGLEVAAPEALFLDDREINVQAARELGIAAIRFQSVEQLRDELAASPFATLPSISERPFRTTSSTE